MQIWKELNGEYEKLLVKPTPRSLKLVEVDKAKNPLARYWKTYLDETCSDNELKAMLRQSIFRKKPYFEAI